MLHKSLPTEGAQVQAGQAQKMEIVGQLTGGIVHDFNNILTVITGTIEILAEAVADQPELAAVAGLIAEAASRGANLTSHLLAFARAQPSQPRDVDVNALVVEAARLLRPTLGEQIEIETTLAPDVAAALVDPHQLMTLMLNLAILARDAMPEGGRLTLETKNAPGEKLGDNSEPADYVRIAVSASCYGIFADYQDRAFVELGMVQDCVKQSNGHIKVVCEAGRGTNVEIYFPRAAARSTAGVARKAPAKGGDEAILIVEDDMLVRKYVVSQVQSLRLPDACGEQCHRGFDDHRCQRNHRSLVHRCDDARPDQRPPAGHRSVATPAIAQGIVHFGLCGKHPAAGKPSRCRCAAAGEAVSQSRSGEDDPHCAGGVSRSPGVGIVACEPSGR